MSSSNNTNFDYKESIISQLDILRKDESSNGNPFKAKAYSLVINQLKICTHPIYSFDDLKNVTGIGEKIHKKIEEIFSTNKLKKAEAILANPTHNSKQIFENVYGIGPTKSKELVERYNIRTILELRNAVKSDPSILNDKQKIGLQYYEDLIQRIPRKEMDIHNEYITTKINQISKGKLKCCIVGSYRRQSESSGDIDVLITATNSELSELEINALFVNCVNSMMKETYIIEVLANGSKKNMSICRLGKDGSR
jgi:DNA polymerase/3'-5' exonuclease PolX